MISVVIPVFNALEYLQITLRSLANNTHYPFELILIDDNSDEGTREFIRGIELDKTLIKSGCTLIKYRNNKQKWVNYNWNLGIKLATQPYVAFLNSDILLAPHWDGFLVGGLDAGATVTCPYQRINGQPMKMSPFQEQISPNQINGSCFMVRKQDADTFFPIPSQLFHWCGDNWIADHSTHTRYVKDVVIDHAISKSNPKTKEYYHLVIRDLLEYERLAHRSMRPVIDLMYKHL